MVGVMTAEERHFLNCQDDNCERTYCVDRRFSNGVIAQLRERLRKIQMQTVEKVDRLVIVGHQHHNPFIFVTPDRLRFHFTKTQLIEYAQSYSIDVGKNPKELKKASLAEKIISAKGWAK